MHASITYIATTSPSSQACSLHMVELRAFQPEAHEKVPIPLDAEERPPAWRRANLMSCVEEQEDDEWIEARLGTRVDPHVDPTGAGETWKLNAPVSMGTTTTTTTGANLRVDDLPRSRNDDTLEAEPNEQESALWELASEPQVESFEVTGRGVATGRQCKKTRNFARKARKTLANGAHKRFLRRSALGVTSTLLSASLFLNIRQENSHVYDIVTPWYASPVKALHKTPFSCCTCPLLLLLVYFYLMPSRTRGFDVLLSQAICCAEQDESRRPPSALSHIWWGEPERLPLRSWWGCFLAEPYKKTSAQASARFFWGGAVPEAENATSHRQGFGGLLARLNGYIRESSPAAIVFPSGWL